MEAMVVTVLDTAGATTASVRLRLSPTMAMADTEAMAVTVTAGATTASVRLQLSPTTDTVDTEVTVADTEAMADTVTAGATMASVRPKPNLRPLLSLTTDTVG